MSDKPRKTLKERWGDLTDRERKLLIGVLLAIIVVIAAVLIKSDKPGDNNVSSANNVIPATSPSPNAIDTQALNSLSSSPTSSYQSELPDNIGSNGPATSDGSEKSSVSVYTASNATSFKIVTSSNYQGPTPSPLLTDKKNVSGWVPVLTGFANEYAKTFTDSEILDWPSRVSPYVDPSRLDDLVSSVDAKNIDPAMPSSIEIVKTGDNYVTSRIKMNDGKSYIVGVVKSGSSWKINLIA